VVSYLVGDKQAFQAAGIREHTQEIFLFRGIVTPAQDQASASMYIVMCVCMYLYVRMYAQEIFLFRGIVTPAQDQASAEVSLCV
jgi:hypothetical protein